MKKAKYESPEFILFCLNADDVIRTSGEGGSAPGGDNGWDTDIGEWDNEM